jgi:phage tail sheath gpL-like
MEQLVKMTAKLYKCRDSAKSLAKMQGEDYYKMIKPYSDIIQNVMVSNNLKHIPALLKISETKIYQDSGMAQMLFMAALTEMLEPSK